MSEVRKNKGRGYKKVTMQTVADKVGVSITTVSHVINHTRPVEISLRKKILEVIEELDYSKERSFSNKRKSLTSHIGLIIPNLKDMNWFKDVIQIVETIASENGYTLLLGDSAFSAEKEKALIEIFMRKHVDGIILGSVLDTPKEIEKFQLFNMVPTVLIDRKWESNKYDFVGIDNFKSAFEATEMAIRKGHKRIAFISLNQPSTNLLERENGYKTAMQAHGCKEFLRTYRLESLKDMTEQVQKILLKNKGLEYIFCYNNSTLYEVLSALKELQIDITKTLKIITYDDSSWFDFLDVPLTVIRQPNTEIGVSAIKTLIEKIEKREHQVEGGKQIIFPTEIIEYSK